MHLNLIFTAKGFGFLGSFDLNKRFTECTQLY